MCGAQDKEGGRMASQNQQDCQGDVYTNRQGPHSMTKVLCSGNPFKGTEGFL